MTSRKRYYELKAAGLCVKCTNPVGDSPSRVKCKECYQGASLKPKIVKCIHCEQAPATVNHSCDSCHAKTIEIKQKLTSKPLSVNMTAAEGYCRVCGDDIDSSGLICDQCLRNTIFSKQDALACYEAKCGHCGIEDQEQLRFISADISKPMTKYGPDLYKAICFSKRKIPDYTIACHSCYRTACINYVSEVREFFDDSQETDDIDTIDV